MRVSVTSTRTVRPSGVVWRRRWKSRPGTWPWLTAFAVSSATISTIASCGSVPYGMPHASRRTAARRRARRAPRGVEVKRISKAGPGGEDTFKRAQRVAGWVVAVGLMGFVVTSLTVLSVA